MSKQLIKFLLASISFLALLSFSVRIHSVGDNPHVISKQSHSSECSSCHVDELESKSDGVFLSKNLPDDLTKFNKDGVAMCSTCHNPNQGHKVGLEIDFPVPADMPLSAENDISCLTCHYAHGQLESERPQASFSFMDRLMDAERLHKSFLLRRNNSDGELCLTCHNVNQGSKP
jgi:hypothetical protein